MNNDIAYWMYVIEDADELWFFISAKEIFEPTTFWSTIVLWGCF